MGGRPGGRPAVAHLDRARLGDAAARGAVLRTAAPAAAGERDRQGEESQPAPSGRRYDNSTRRRQAAGTRERIVDAGVELLHGGSIRDWRSLTVRGVAERAGVSERTVYRHLGHERGLRDAVMHRLEEQAGIDLAGMDLDDVAEVTRRVFDHVSAYPLATQQLDPTLSAANERQRTALRRAVGGCADRWPEGDRAVVAAVLDLLWSVGAYERLAADWGLDHGAAVRGLTWVIGLVIDAVREDRRPR